MAGSVDRWIVRAEVPDRCITRLTAQRAVVAEGRGEI
jgi:hypothetical protein